VERPSIDSVSARCECLNLNGIAPPNENGSGTKKLAEALIRPQSAPADERHGESRMTTQQVNWLQIFLRRIRFAVERA